MIIVLKPHASDIKINEVVEITKKLGYEPKVIKGVEHTVVAAVGDERKHQTLEVLKTHPIVQSVLPIQKQYKLASREYHPKSSKVKIGDFFIGDGNFQVIAGPCSVEGYEQMKSTTQDLYKSGVRIIRGGAYKPRSSPYSFQGLGEEGLEILKAMKDEFGVAIVTEAVGVSQLEKIANVADCIQIGARNCQNYHLLEMVAKVGKSILLKRGMSSTVNEWLSSAEYLLVNGCPSVILCERGIRTFETATRNTMDVGAIAVAKIESHFPVIADPSHAAGRVDLILPLSKAAIGAGADGLIVESHSDPVNACSDAAQQIKSSDFHKFMKEIELFTKLNNTER